MNLHGWDTANIVSFDLINRALEDQAKSLITRFKFVDGPIHLEGRFGPWRVVPGGALQKLHLQIPIVEGWIKGLRRERKTKLDGTALTVEIGLRLLPRPDGTGASDLVFDLGDGGTPETRPIRGIDIEITNTNLNEAQIEMTRLALVDCLNAHAEQIAFVFATIETRGSATDAWLRLPHVDFANLELVDGPNYLAIMGSRVKPTPEMALDRFDIKLLDGHPPAIFAASHALYASGVLAPWMNGNFKPKAAFTPASVAVPGSKRKIHGVAMKGAVALPKADSYEPVLETLTLALDGAYLRAFAKAKVHIGVGCHLQVTIEITHRFGLDPKSGRFSLKPVGKPVEKHWFDANNPLGWIVAAGATIIEWLIPSLRNAISGALMGIAAKMDTASNPLQQPRIWRGLRDFQPQRFLTSGCFWLADLRAPEPLTFHPPDKDPVRVASQ